LDPTSNVATGTSLQDLIERIGSEHVERRLKIEVEHEAQLFGQGLIFFNLENWYAAPWIVRTALKLTGFYGRARRNADHVVVKKHSVAFANLPPAFHNFTILHISDLHADISVGAMRHLVSVVGGLQYDICVLTGDYRGKTYGPFEKSLEIIDELQAQLKGPVYGVLGNHDSIRMAPSMEAMGFCCSTSANRLFVMDNVFSWPALTIRISIGQTTLRKPRRKFLQMPFRFCWRTRRKFTIERCAPDSISCYADTPTEVSFAYPVEFRSSWRRRYLDSWALDHGDMAPWSDIPRWALAPAFCCALKLPAGDNSAYLARWAAALAHEQVRGRKQNAVLRAPRSEN
jgi:hypothetical protein